LSRNEGAGRGELGGVAGAALLVVLGGQYRGILGTFVEHERVSGEDWELHGVEAGYGVALGSACAGGFGNFMRLATICLGIGMKGSRLESSRRFWGCKAAAGPNALEWPKMAKK